MRAVCLCTPVEDPDRFARAQAHFRDVGRTNVDYLLGRHKSTAGLDSDHLYMVDRGPGSPDAGVPYRMGKHPVNIWLGHYMAWQALKLAREEVWLILETDAKFLPDWKARAQWAIKAVQRVDPDWDLLYLGSCNCRGHQTVRVAGDDTLGLYVVHGSGPQCNHAYVLRAKAVPTFETTLRRVWAPIDIQQTSECFEHGRVLPRSLPFDATTRRLKVYTVLPRIVDQWDTELTP